MTLINGVNDTPSELAALATWLQVFPAGAILVNLIPMNASPAAPPNWRASSLENARARAARAGEHCGNEAK
jgi:adenine C2-methylase RlmN of 23S rRNA A2503 and tRNA A37